MPAIILWLVIGVGVILLDIGTSLFLFVWFAIGSVVAIIAALVGLSFAWQLILFGISSIIAISIGYPWSRKKFKNTVNRTKLMEEEYIGKTFIASEDIDYRYRFKVSGIYWTGENKGEKILKGQKFQVVGIEGNKLVIEGIREE
ncbi:NfeD family protein [Clostridium paraputrificum]|uniref:Nodulation efficiency protein D n=1 Tax=Clostridium paraputrificum TaxID=29363 RepID=A0A1B8RNQ3_9CLOT|nr:NfeD family protein [Clostridium sp.]OBY10354.1 nodulation efficiency protein D [Clostridium paraputrificum]RKI49299.1 NfeD family protein [Clostridium paraputrificum]